MTSVGVLCAYNPGNNGMASVDIAARTLLRARGVDHTMINVHRLKRDRLKPFKFVRDPARLAAFSHLIYWGDFQNNPLYGMGDFLEREVHYGHSSSCIAGRAYWIRTFLELAASLEGTTSVASIGNCFLGCESFHGDTEITTAFRRFCEHAALIVPREDLSLKALRALSGTQAEGHVVPGLDAAFLHDWGLPRRDSPQFSYCFRRSRIEVPGADVAALEKRTQLRAIPLPWQETSLVFHRGLKRSIRQMCASRFVLTDIYHVCVNALNLGVPAICLSNPGRSMEGTLSDSKKAALFETIGATDWLVEVEPGERLASVLDAIVGVAQHLATDASALRRVLENIQARRGATLSALDRFLGLN